jgi:carbamoyl-phosphate synthase large subunit
LVRAFHRAYQRLGLDGRVIGTDTDWLAPALQVVDRAILVPRYTDRDFLPRLLDECSNEYVSMLLPLADPEIPILAAARSDFHALGVRMGVVEAVAADISGDKWLTAEFFRRLSLATPRSVLPESLDQREFRFPCFIKPRWGSAGIDAYRCDSEQELEFFLPRVPQPIIQEFIHGPEVTTDVVCDFQGRMLTQVSRQRIAVRGGEAMKSVTINHPMVSDACHLIADALPARGPLTVQCILNGSIPYFIEINARLGGGVPLSIAAGLDVPAILLSLAAGLPVDALIQQPIALGLYMTRCDESLFVTEFVQEKRTRS